MPIDDGLIKKLLDELEDPIARIALRVAFEKLSSSEPSEVFEELFSDLDAHRYQALLFTYALVMGDEYRKLEPLTLESLLVTGKRRGLMEKYHKYRIFATLARLDVITESGPLGRIKSAIRDSIRSLVELSKHASFDKDEFDRLIELIKFIYTRLEQTDKSLSKEFEEVLKAFGISKESFLLEKYVSFSSKTIIDGEEVTIYLLKPEASTRLEDIIQFIKSKRGIPRFHPDRLSKEKREAGRKALEDHHRLAKLLYLSSFPRRGTEAYLGEISEEVARHLDLRRVRKALLRYLVELYCEDPRTPPEVFEMGALSEFASNTLAYLRGADVSEVPPEIRELSFLVVDDYLKDTRLWEILNGLKVNLALLKDFALNEPKPFVDPNYSLPESVYANRIAIAYASLLGKDVNTEGFERFDRTLVLYRSLLYGKDLVNAVRKYESLKPHKALIREYLQRLPTLPVKPEAVQFRRHEFSPLGRLESIVKARAYYEAYKKLLHEDPREAKNMIEKAFSFLGKPYDPIDPELREFVVELISTYSAIAGTTRGRIYEAFRWKRHAFHDYSVHRKYLLGRELLKRGKYLQAYAVLKSVDLKEIDRLKELPRRDFLLKRYILSRLVGDKKDVEDIKGLCE